MMLSTPGGSISAQSSPNSSVVSGVVGAGFATTVLPASSAGATLIISSTSGKFHGVIAATTPTYAWVPIVGLIAAAVVAGIYGARAVEALDRARAAQGKINELAASLAADANLMTAINSAQIGMNRIVADVAAALPVIQKIQGVWGGISSDLGHISSLIDTDIRQVPPIIMSLGVDEAVRAWHNVALNADAYRVNAYVKQAPGVASMEAWQVANQFTSTRTVAA